MNETVTQLFFYIGLCFVLRYGSILNKLREFLSKVSFFKQLFNCSLCLGWHVGFWSSLIFGLPLLICFKMAFVSAAVCWIADHFIMFARTFTEKK